MSPPRSVSLARTAAGLAVLAAALPGIPPPGAARAPSPPPVPRAAPAAPAAELAALPLAFEPNLGQTHPEVRFLARGSGCTLFVTDDGAMLAGGGPRRPVLRLRLVGARPHPAVAGDGRQDGVVHYLRGEDPAKWVRDVPTFGRVTCLGAWPGIDVVWHGDGRRLEYDFVVAPGADADRVAIDFEGASDVGVDDAGDLVLGVDGGEVRQPRPRVFEEAVAGGERREIEGRWEIRGPRRAGFRVEGRDAAHAVVIDPSIVFSTYVGGSGSESANDLFVDPSGNVYVTGTVGSTDYPLANPLPGAPSSGSSDAFVTKVSMGGARLVYSTYLGGGGADTGWGIRADAGGIYVAGSTTSADFPRVNAFQDSFGGGSPEGDAFLTRLAPDGSSVLYSTFLGGSGDDGCRGLALHATGGVVLAGTTKSLDFPATAGAFQPAPLGAGDGWVACFAPGGGYLVFATLLGGSGAVPDTLEGVALDRDGNVLVAGYTAATDFPVTPGAFQPRHGGGTFDGWAAKLSPAGVLLAATYLGGFSDDACRKIAVDDAGDVYVAGFTLSENFPTRSPLQRYLDGGVGSGDAFVTVFAPSLGSLVYSTYFGGRDDEDVGGLHVDGGGTAYLAGSTTSIDIPVQDPLQPGYAGGRDAFLAKIAPGGTPLVYSTYLGRSGYEAGTAVGADAAGDAYIAGAVASADWPTSCAAQPRNAGGPQDWFVARLSEVPPGPPAKPTDPAAAAVSVAGIDFTWTDASRDECRFRVERRVGDAPFASLGEVDAGATLLADRGLEPDRTYTYRVLASNALGDSEWSDEASATTPETIFVAARKGEIRDSARPRRDSARVKGVFLLLASSPDNRLLPADEAVEIGIGDPAAPAVLLVPARDAGWREVRGGWRWRSAPRARPRAAIDLDFDRGLLEVRLSRFDFPAPPADPVRLTLRSGNDAGHRDRTWKEKAPGRLKLKKASGFKD